MKKENKLEQCNTYCPIIYSARYVGKLSYSLVLAEYSSAFFLGDRGATLVGDARILVCWIRFNRVCLLSTKTFDTIGQLCYALGGRIPQFWCKVFFRQFLHYKCVTPHTTTSYLFTIAIVLYAGQCFDDIKLLVMLWFFYFQVHTCIFL